MLSYEELGPERTFSDDIVTHARTSGAAEVIVGVVSRIESDGAGIIIAFEAGEEDGTPAVGIVDNVAKGVGTGLVGN